MRLSVLYALIFAVQLACAVFFVSDIVMTVLGLRLNPISWQLRETLEIGAAIGLILGVVLGGAALRSSYQRSRRAQARLNAVSAAFLDVVADRFADWGLTAAERDVALFLLKGLSTQEVAALRNTSEGTVKAQTNAIYRKSGVSGRPQFLSLFIDDLMTEAHLPSPETHTTDPS